MTKVIFVVLVMAFFGGLEPLHAVGTKLAPQWKQGEISVFRMEINKTQKVFVPGRQEPIETKMSTVEEFALSSLAGDGVSGWDLEFEILFLSVGLGRPGRPSGMGPEVVVREVVGKKARIKASVRGQLGPVKGLGFANKEMLRGNPNLHPAITQEVFGVTTEGFIRQTIAFVVTAGLPDRTLDTGDTWSTSQTFVMGSLGPVQINLDYRVVGQETHMGRDCVVLERTGSVVQEGGGRATGPRILESQIRGKVWFDPLAGKTIDQKNRLEMVIRQPGSTPAQFVRIEVEQDASIRLKP